MKLRWFLSSRVRHTSDLCGHVRKLRNAQSDLLSDPALTAIDGALQQTQAALDANADDVTLAKRCDELEKTASRWLKPYPHAEWRENVEVFLVAIAVAMSIRTFFLQPFKIPTSSMQPTLFGVTVEPLYDSDFQMPGQLTRIGRLIVEGSIYHQVIAPQDGYVESVGPPEHFLRFFNQQTIVVRYHDGTEAPITLWFTPDPSNNESFEHRTGLDTHREFHQGEPIVRFVETTGDHLFVDRFTYNFRHPDRGEIVVFKTRGLPMPPSEQDQFYIKRLVGLPGETISIGDDRHARVNGRRLDASTPHFENVYSFTNTEAADSHFLRDQFYSGHILRPGTHLGQASDQFTVQDHRYLVFGDNTFVSYDSRFWGDVPEHNIIGKAWFVYWPISSRPPAHSRFGWYPR